VLKKQQVNPTTWQEKFGFSQGWRVDDPKTLLFVAGQIPVDEHGTVVGEGDFEAQTRQTFENMGRVLVQAGMTFDNVVQVGVFMTDISQLRTYARVRDEFVNTAAPPASTALGVVAFALPGMLVEVNAIAVA
jgi:enamine deaminase RidA (YjgF/YER057c/UK114 family)